MVYNKDYFNIESILGSIQNKGKSNRLSSFLSLAKNCKPCQIYRRMHDVYGEEFLVKNVCKINMGLLLSAFVEKTDNGIKTHRISSK